MDEQGECVAENAARMSVEDSGKVTIFEILAIKTVETLPNVVNANV